MITKESNIEWISADSEEEEAKGAVKHYKEILSKGGDDYAEVMAEYDIIKQYILMTCEGLPEWLKDIFVNYDYTDDELQRMISDIEKI